MRKGVEMSNPDSPGFSGKKRKEERGVKTERTTSIPSMKRNRMVFQNEERWGTK